MVWTLSLSVFCACGGASPGHTHQGPPLDDADYPTVYRAYFEMPPTSESRLGLRERLVAYQLKHAGVIAELKYDDLLDLFIDIMSLHGPEDFEMGGPSRQLRPVLERVLELATPRGDQGPVLAASLIISGWDDENDKSAAKAAALYKRVNKYAHASRRMIRSPLERYTRLISVWEVHAALSPAPTVLATLVKLHNTRRTALLAASKNPEQQLGQRDMFAVPAIIQQAPLAVAATHLRHGDLKTALKNVKAMDNLGGHEGKLIELMTAAQTQADALLELAGSYAGADPQTTRGVCRVGTRRHAKDMRFPLCLAQISAKHGEMDISAAWYAEAIERDPGNREIYDEAIEVLRVFLERAPADLDPRTTRALTKEADKIFSERRRRWPSAQDSEHDRLFLAVGLMEMNAGNIREARARFEQALQIKETSSVHEQLGRLDEAEGKFEKAIDHYKRALELQKDTSSLQAKLQLQGGYARLGDAQRFAGQTDAAHQSYEKGLKLLDGLDSEVNALGKVELLVRRGILESWLGRTEASSKTFHAAMKEAESLRSAMSGSDLSASSALQQVYARILSHLVVAPTAQPKLAGDAFVATQRQLNMDPEWKVYFALWVKLVAARAGGDTNREVELVLGQFEARDAWYGWLARFGLGKASYQDLLDHAENIGQEAEAHFYEAARLVAEKNDAAARSLYEKTLSTGMVNFYEFTMSRELLQQARKSESGTHASSDPAATHDEPPQKE